MLYGVAQSMLVRSTRCSWLKAWTLQVAGRCVTDDRVASSCRRHVRLGHKRTLADVRVMSALPPKADMDQTGSRVIRWQGMSAKISNPSHHYTGQMHGLR
jgi:hypothetical protein